MAAEVIAAGIGAGSSLIGGIMGRSAANEQRKEARRRLALEHQMWREEFDYNKQQGAQSQANWEREHYYRIRDTAADARAAGLHPLFALGAAGAGGGGGFIPGQAPSGSFSDAGYADYSMGNAVSEAGARVADALGRQPSEEDKQQAALQELFQLEQLKEIRSRTALNQAEAEKLWSDTKLGAQQALYSGSVPGSAQAVGALPGGSVKVEPATGYAPKKVETPMGWLDRKPLQGQGMNDLFGDVIGEAANIGLGLKSILEARGRDFQTYQKMFNLFIQQMGKALGRAIQ